MMRLLKIGWQILWGLFELLVLVAVLNQIRDNNTALIISAIGLVYATIRGATLSLWLTIVRISAARDIQFFELKELLHGLATMQSRLANDLWAEQLSSEPPTRPDIDGMLSKHYTGAAIAGGFTALIYLVCLYQFFSRI